jgi:TP901 family phage tail tape measure protein
MSTEKFTAEIEINSRKATSELNRLEKQMDSMRDAQKALLDSRKKGDADRAKAMQQSIDDLSKRIREQKKYVKGLSVAFDDLSKRSYKDLRTAQLQLEKQLKQKDIERYGEEWRFLTGKIKECKAEMQKFKDATTEQQTMWGRFSDFMNRNLAGIASVAGAITGLSATVRSTVEDYAKMEEAMADTRKYTGLSSEGVHDLNEELKKMDTRTSREELNALAGAAGRLGITSKASIMEFVDAADKIGVALGDDLGDGAVDQIGKLAMAFGEDDRLGLRGAMLATGSAINELAQNSAAKAGYLVEFTARVAGVGKQLGLTQSQIMGFATVMDENLLKDEMAATAFSQLLTKMATNTAQFASFAGMKVEDFTKLVKNDLNGAILALADNLRKQDATTMMQNLTDMKMDGARAVGVLANLADKIDDVRKHQKTANEAYAEGTSVLEEFDVMNNTVEARLDKVKKRFHEMTVELGERLQPIVQYTISSVGLLTKALSAITSFVLQFRTAILTATIALTALYLAKEKDIIITKLQVFWNETLVANAKKLWATLAANPYAAIAAAAAVLVAVMADLIRKSNELSRAQKAMADVEHEATVKAETERVKLEQLRKVVHDNTRSLDERRQAINELRKIVPEYTAQISAEGRVYRENTAALDDYIQKLKEEAMVKGAQQKLEELGRERAELLAQRMEQAEHEREVRERNRRGPQGAIAGSVGIWSNQAQETVSDAAGETLIKNIDKKIDETDKAIKRMTDVAKQTVAVVQNAGDSGSGGSGGGGGGGSDTDKKNSKTDPYNADLKDLETAYKQRQLVIKQQLADGLITEQQYQELSYNQEMTFLQSKVELQEKYGKDTSDTQIAMLDKTMAQAKLANERSAKQMQADLTAAEDAYQADLTELLRLRSSGIIASEQEYQNRRKEIVIDYLQQRLAIVRQYGGDTVKEEQALLNQQLSDADDFRKQLKEAFEDAYDNAPTYDDQREYLRSMYELQLIDAQDYQDKLTEMEEEEGDKRDRIRKLFYQQAQELVNNYGQYVKAACDLEVANITASYDKQIAAAGKNTKLREKLERERDEKIRAAKTKANQKAMKIEIAQAMATTATNALSAFGAVLQLKQPWTVPLAYAAAAAATANGLLQIATIKKQHQAEQAGYYEGGFTGGHRYRKEAGVVHEGEFVANHEAVQNRNILPMLELIDKAQRNNRVGALTADDLAGATGNKPTVVAPVVNVTTDNTELRDTLSETHSVLDRLASRLEEGIGIDLPIDGENGLYRTLKRYESLINNP